MTFIIQRSSEDLALFVFDEEDNEMLLSHRISSDDVYRKQEGETFNLTSTSLPFLLVQALSLLSNRF